MELDERSRGVGLADRDLDAWMYLSRKLSSQEDVESLEPDIVVCFKVSLVEVILRLVAECLSFDVVFVLL